MTTEEALLQYVNPNDLTEHPEAHRIPEMTTDEWAEFSESVRLKGEITDPIFAMRNGVVFDGRHRLRAAITYGVRLVPVLFYAIENDEALERMSDAAVLRRQLTPGQRAAVVLEFTELVEKIREVSKGRQGVRTDRTSGPIGHDVQSGGTRKVLADRAGVGSGTIQRLTEVQRDEPELFEKVKTGEITVNKAYTELKKRKQEDKPADKSDKPVAEKLERIKQRKKPEPIEVREGESVISPNNRLGMFVTEGLTPFIDDLLASYHTAKMADEEARKPYIQELEVVFEASFRILAELKGDALLKKMEEIQNDEE